MKLSPKTTKRNSFVGLQVSPSTALGLGFLLGIAFLRGFESFATVLVRGNTNVFKEYSIHGAQQPTFSPGSDAVLGPLRSQEYEPSQENFKQWPNDDSHDSDAAVGGIHGVPGDRTEVPEYVTVIEDFMPENGYHEVEIPSCCMVMLLTEKNAQFYVSEQDAHCLSRCVLHVRSLVSS